MTKQNQAAEAKPGKKCRATAKPIVNEAPTDELAGLAQLARVAGEPTHPRAFLTEHPRGRGNGPVHHTLVLQAQQTCGNRVVQRLLQHDAGIGEIVQRVCTPASVCSVPIAGSAEEFDIGEEQAELGPRERRARMSRPRARASGHAGRARQLEQFLDAQAPGLRANIHGIFIDMDMAETTGAFKMSCAAMVPPITGATRPCVFVHGELNRQALVFNTTAQDTVGGVSREDWRIQTLQLLTHEVQHAIYDVAAHTTPAGITTPTCIRANIGRELSELNAIISEFPAVYRAVPPGSDPTHPARQRLDNWFDWAITNPYESIRGILETIGCQCECPEVDAFVTDTFNFVAGSWSRTEKAAFNAELRRPVWGLRWPL